VCGDAKTISFNVHILSVLDTSVRQSTRQVCVHSGHGYLTVSVQEPLLILVHELSVT